MKQQQKNQFIEIVFLAWTNMDENIQTKIVFFLL